ncbi:MFS transporter [Humibacillus xanthopallidus]|uniref:EmrB/QacA subfamily drug resistance transporter n=1 Tax=Humibacillus xanthopallidus TaxID=412689 RepID=A0A543I1J0_9MICO|nr:MFS transporter [Humibacillus xanthopallidus]TQM64441.1 EmrB/QacA subfamily drug resistance transporter [Humibacillus xanthopallidus]
MSISTTSATATAAPIATATPTAPVTTATAPGGAARRSAIGLGVVLVAQLMLVLDATVVNVALPHIQTDLGFTPAGLSWVLNAYTLAFGGLLLLGGRLGDVFGRLRSFEIGLAVFTVASLLGGLATTPAWLIAARTLQGVGAALAAPSVLALVTTSAPNEAARNRGLALFTAVSSAGASIGLLLGGALTDFVSWHWTLFVNVPIGAVVLVLARRFVTETPRVRVRFDVVGAVTATLGSVSVVHGFISAADRGWSSPITLASFAVGLLLLALFVRAEGRVAAPLLPLGLVRERSRAGALVLMALVVGAQFSTFFLVTQYLQLVLGFSPVATGAAFLPLSLAIFATSRVSARLVALVGPRPLLLVGTLGLTASFVWLSSITTTSTYAAHLLGALVLNGVSAALVFMPVTVIVLGGVDRAQAGTVSGLLQTAQQLGGAVGLAAIVSVYASQSVPGQFVPGVEPAFLTSAGFTLTALIVAAVVLRPRRRSADEAVAARPDQSADQSASGVALAAVDAD